MDRSARLLGGAVLAIAVLGVGYMVLGLTSAFTCDGGSDCFLARFFAPTSAGVEDGPSSSAMLASSALPAAQESQVAGTTAPAPLALRAAEEPTAFPAVVRSPHNLTLSEGETPASPELRESDAAQMIPADAETPAPAEPEENDAAPITGIPPTAISAAAAEPEPGVLTDPPAGEVPDWKPIPDRSQGPILFLPIVVVPTPAPAPRGR
jgi:hypothetical protein